MGFKRSALDVRKTRFLQLRNGGIPDVRVLPDRYVGLQEQNIITTNDYNNL